MSIADLEPAVSVDPSEAEADTTRLPAAEVNGSVGERLFELATATRAQLAQLPPAVPVLSEEVLSGCRLPHYVAPFNQIIWHHRGVSPRGRCGWDVMIADVT